MPDRATIPTTAASTSGGETSRRIASTTIQIPKSASVSPFACAARISTRPKPKVQRPPAGRAAMDAATSASASAAASVSMCPASARSASELARIPKTTSATMKASRSASESPSSRRSAAPVTWAPPWS